MSSKADTVPLVRHLQDREWTGPAAARTRWLTLVAIAALVAVVSAGQLTPRTTAAAGFSVARAQAHLETLAAVPRPIGSQGHAAARQYLVDRFRALGLETEIQQEFVTRWPTTGRVANVVARLNGTARGAPVLLVAHYDTIPHSVGATDDGLGVAIALEAMNVLTRQRPAHDVIAVMTDGEEAALLGAIAAESKLLPQLGRVAGIVNLEGRGSAGPALLFQTNAPNGRAVQWLAHAGGIRTSSIYNAAYTYLRYATDLSILASADRPSVNLAFIAKQATYHTREDVAADVDWASAQELGETVLRLLATPPPLSSTDDAARERVYFDLLGRVVISYASAWSPVCAGGLILIWGLTAWRVRRRNGWSLFAVVAGAVASVVIVIGLALGGYGLARAALPAPEPWTWPFWASFAVTVTCVACEMVARRFPQHRAGVWLGCALPFVALSAAVAVLVPAVSYVLQWPCLAMLLGIGLGEGRRRPYVEAIARVAIVSAAVLIVLPVIIWLWIGLAGGLSVAAPVFVIGCTLLTLSAMPAMSWLTGAVRWTRAGASAAALLGVTLVLAMRESRATASGLPPARVYVAMPQRNDSGWLTFPRFGTPEFARNLQQPPRLLFPEFGVAGSYSAAALMPLSMPRTEVISDRVEGVTRTLRLRVTSTRHAPLLYLWVAGEGIEYASLEGRPFEVQRVEAGTRQKRWIRVVGLSDEGVELVVRARVGQVVRLTLSDQTYGLPEGLGATSGPGAGWMTDATFVTAEYEW